MTKLSREDMMEAVANGMREGIVELGTSGGRFDIPHELLFDAVRQGVRDAFWQMITNATDMPCADFYDTVRDGIEAAMKDLRREDCPLISAAVGGCQQRRCDDWTVDPDTGSHDFANPR